MPNSSNISNNASNFVWHTSTNTSPTSGWTHNTIPNNGFNTEIVDEAPESPPNEWQNQEPEIQTSPGQWQSMPPVTFTLSPNLVPSLFSQNQIDELYEQLTKVNRMSLDDDEPQEIFYNKTLTKLIPFRTGVKKTGLLGLEIECEGTNLFQSPFKYWTCHADGSLRETQGHPPQEYVLREPLSLSELDEALRYLEEKLKDSGSSIVKSNRTSVHVHVNCQTMTLKQLYCYICLYMIFEELLIDWLSPQRAGNLFCLRAKDSEYYITMLETVIKNQNFKSWREDHRYSACNVASILKFGSLEFRALHGTVDRNTIMTWARVLVHLKEQAEKLYQNPIEIVEDFQRLGPLPFFKKVFDKEELRRLLENIPGISGKLWDGLRLMRDVAYVIPEWKPQLAKKKRTRVMKRDQVIVDEF